MESMASCTLRIQTDTSDPFRQGWKKTWFSSKKTSPVVFMVFFGFFGLFGVFCPEESFLGFFSVSRILLGASRL
jgi:hypothetical protein